MLAQATTREPDAMDEGLRLALHALRNRFACNDISGCPAEDQLVAYGWGARTFLEQVFDRAGSQASYRPRTVRIIADLRDPTAQPWLLRLVGDRDPEVKAYALYGLGLLDAMEHRALVKAHAGEDNTVWLAPVRLTSLWVLHRWGDAEAGSRLVRLLAELAPQQMAGPALAWGVALCIKPGAPDCGAALPGIATHPSFTARRAAARAMAAMPRAGHAAALVALTADPVHSIAELADAALRTLAKRPDLEGPGAWRTWCLQTQCDAVQLELPQLPTATTQ